MAKRVSIVHTELVKEKTVLYECEGRVSIEKSWEAADFMRQFFKNADKEMVYVCCLDGANKPVSVEMIAKGDINSCVVAIPQVFKAAIIQNAASIMLFHNHPSGNLNISKGDWDTTERVKKSGKLLGIELLDHIVIGDTGSWVSLREEISRRGGEW